MLSPASRGALLTASIISYEFMGLVGGYYGGRLYKSMKGKEWKRAAFLTGKKVSLSNCLFGENIPHGLFPEEYFSELKKLINFNLNF